MTHVLGIRRLLAVVVLLFIVLTALVIHGPLAFDSTIHDWMVDHRNQTVTDWAVRITRTGIGPISYVFAFLAGWLAGYLRRWRRQWLGPLLAVAGLAGAQVLRQGMAQVIDRPRPPMADWAFTAAGPSYPSGHTTTSTTVAALFCLAVLGVRDREGRPFRLVLFVLVSLWALGVGLTRVYLGVHWPTDVLGGWLLGTAFALLAVLTDQSISARRSATRAAPPEGTGR